MTTCMSARAQIRMHHAHRTPRTHACAHSGLFSSYVTNRTALWRTGCPFGEADVPSKAAYDQVAAGGRKASTFDGDLQQGGCTKEGLRSWLDSPALKAVVTAHHTCFDHPKVMSIPLGISPPISRVLLRLLLQDRNETCKSTGIAWLMINFSEWAHRKQIGEVVLRNFPHLSNMYGKDPTGKSGEAFSTQFYYFTQMRCSRFVLCPSGLGWDTYRLWESLSLGAIPIVEDSPGWIRVLDDLPVLIVKNFAEVTPQLLEREYEQIMNNLHKYNFKRLTRQWWLEHVRSLLPRSKDSTIADPPPQDTSVCGPRFARESEGCMQNHQRKPDCCAIDGEGDCADGFEGYQSDDMCWHNGGAAGGGAEVATLFAFRTCCTNASTVSSMPSQDLGSALSDSAPSIIPHTPKDAFSFLGNGPCRDQYGTEPAHWSCQEKDGSLAMKACKLACIGAACSGFQVCEELACAGLCVVFVEGPDREWGKRCTFVPGSAEAVAQISHGERMWKCFKRGDTTMAPLDSPSSALPLVDPNPLIDGIR